MKAAARPRARHLRISPALPANEMGTSSAHSPGALFPPTTTAERPQVVAQASQQPLRAQVVASGRLRVLAEVISAAQNADLTTSVNQHAPAAELQSDQSALEVAPQQVFDDQGNPSVDAGDLQVRRSP